MKRLALLGATVLVLAGCGQSQVVTLGVTPGPVVWGVIQPTADASPEEWVWLGTDLALDVEPNPSIVVPIWPYALWDQAQCHGDYASNATLYGDDFQAPYTPCNTVAYSEWVKAVITRYHQNVVAWQVLYEPHLQRAPFAQYQDSAPAYIDLLKTTADAVHHAQANATVLSALIPKLDTEALLFWGPVLQDPAFNANVDAVAVVANTVDEWTAMQSVLERYHISKPVWVFSDHQDMQFAGSARVVYTGQ